MSCCGLLIVKENVWYLLGVFVVVFGLGGFCCCDFEFEGQFVVFQVDMYQVVMFGQFVEQDFFG